MTRNYTLVYESLSHSGDNDQEEEVSGIQRDSEIICKEQKNDLMAKDIPKNKTSKECHKMFVTMQGLGMSESTIKRKRNS